MALKLARILALVLVLVALAAPAGHVLEIPGKWRLAPEVWLAVQQNLYPGHALAGMLGFVGAPLACAWLAIAARGTAEARHAWLAAGLVLASLVVWWLVVAPVNAEVAAAAPETLSPEWPAWRLRWEAGHAAEFLLNAAALGVLLRGWWPAAGGQAASAASASAARSAGQA